MNVRRLARISLLSLSSLASACVLPRDGVQGLEIGWSIPERLPEAVAMMLMEGDEAPERSYRTCAGGGVGSVVLSLLDLENPERARDFDYDCTRAVGDSEVDVGVVATNSVFVELDSGDYLATLRALDPVSREVLVQSDFSVEVTGGINPLHWSIATDPVPLSLELSAVAPVCAVRMQLRHADPAVALLDLARLPDAADGDDADTTVRPYRLDLLSQLGLPLHGEPLDCAFVAAGVHEFEAIDRGSYVLDVEIDYLNGDRRLCEFPFEASGAQGVQLALDLSLPPC